MKISNAIPQLPSFDLMLTKNFYESLGFSCAALLTEHGIAILERDDIVLHFWKTDSEEQAQEYGKVSSCYLIVEGIDQLYQEFQHNRVTFRYGLQTMPWGMREMQVDDPYGNAIKFGEKLND
ncbi:bleomycin resistance protein [Pseudobacteriovorax antillogorgiicola]|uniref:Bleomycin resistance protein n=1 Tax=Pseudobacteriovorax antillogorgiicola TaxID=1513793 RepID=A0A1Y6CPT7_9BACT|nr:VOC family protein [Pseudobacteriovorax antillogorgiicola]TCS42748.1 hypothetical protein EDD56_14016 [Pseudobacteriovorax antillogorgiicola]SMF82240.1 hypothetical protein SAMN06296036_14016 [Pseudobacteriovorax antillogorgiicola]